MSIKTKLCNYYFNSSIIHNYILSIMSTMIFAKLRTENIRDFTYSCI